MNSRSIPFTAIALLITSLQAMAYELTRDEDARLLNCRGREAIATTKLSMVPVAPSQDSPECGSYLYMKGIPQLKNNYSNCYRLCAAIPAGHVYDNSRPIGGWTSHAWSRVAGPPQWFPDTNKACLPFKNWSADEAATATLIIPIKPGDDVAVESTVLSTAIEQGAVYKVAFDRLATALGSLKPSAVVTGFYCAESKWENWSPSHPTNPNQHFLYWYGNGGPLDRKSLPKNNVVNIWGQDFKFDATGTIFHPGSAGEPIGNISVLPSREVQVNSPQHSGYFGRP